MIFLPAHRNRSTSKRTRWMVLLLLVQIAWGAAAARAAWITNGNAYPAGDDIVVTPEAGNSAGSAWMDARVDLNADFDITLLVNLGDRDGSGADGISIVLQNDPAGTAALGDTAAGGEWVGIHGISPALAIEIDTYQNTGRGDPPCDHLGVNEIRSAFSQPEHTGAGPVCADGGDPDVEDGRPHAVRLTWNSAAHILTVYWDGVQRLIYTNDIAADLFGGASSAWFGVVGSTGGAYNQQQFRALVNPGEVSVTKHAAPTEVDPGDPVDYTITIRNAGNISAFVTQIEDILPAGFSYLPGTASGLSAADPTVSGQRVVWPGNWPVAPGQTATLSFQARSANLPGGYQNQAAVRGANFAEAATGPTADVTVRSESTPPAFGTKPLYVRSAASNTLSRLPASPVDTPVRINGNNRTETWILAPALAAPLTIDGAAGEIPIELYLSSDGDSSWFGNWRNISVAVSTSSGIEIGASPSRWLRLYHDQPAQCVFTVPVSGDIMVPVGDAIRLTVRNASGQGNNRILVHPEHNGNHSRVALEAKTVINVDQVLFFDAPYPGGNRITSAAPGQTVHIRATVSDPFGSFDITGAALALEDPAGHIVLGSPALAPMTEVADATAATKIYEFSHTLPAHAMDGIWTARVTAEEGREGLVRHTGTGALTVASPDIVLLKSVAVESDPINGSARPKAIPGAYMIYTLVASNQGGAAADADSVQVTDPVPANTDLFVGDLGAPGSGPVLFHNGATASGLTYTFGGLSDPGDDVAFSNNNGATFDYTPVPDANGFDAHVTHIRIRPKGAFNAAGAGSAPSFQLRLRVKVQ